MTEIAQVDAPPPPSAIITLDPTSYVAAVYAPFREKLDAAKAEADKAEFDITTTAGMEIAKKHRAVFRDEFRLAIEKARTERKAPILEIGRLLDGRAKEITAEVAPYEKRFDDAIKAEEQRKADIKAAKEEAERQRVAGIRARITDTQAVPAKLVGQPSTVIADVLAQITEAEITLETFAEFAGEAELIKAQTVAKLQEMLTAQQQHEAEQQRLAEERAEFERQRAEQAERERQEAEARAEEERKAREARELEDALVDSIWKNARRIESNTAPYIRKAIGIFESMAKDWESDPRHRVSGAIASAREEMQMKLRDAEEAAEREAREEELRRQRETEEAQLAEQRAALQRQQDEFNAARAEQERKEREAREAAEAEALAQQEAEEAAARAEAQRSADEKTAAEAEQARRDRVQFELNGPAPSELVSIIAVHYMVEQETALNWLCRHEWAAVEVAA